MLLAVALCLVFLVYIVWWTILYRDEGLSSDPSRPITASYRFNHWLPQFLLWVSVRDANRRALINRAVTLPHPWRCKAVVLVAKHYISGAHRAHEVAGHGKQIVVMGPVDYLATYVWHYILRRGVWAEHMMEKDAQTAERLYAATFSPIGTP